MEEKQGGFGGESFGRGLRESLLFFIILIEDRQFFLQSARPRGVTARDGLLSVLSGMDAALTRPRQPAKNPAGLLEKSDLQ